MPTITVEVTTAASPRQVIAALTDFGPDRAETWGLSSPKYLRVHSQSSTTTDVTEGSSGVWERLHYDWGTPGIVRMTTVDSNAWSNASGHTYRFSTTPDGRTQLSAVVVRSPKNVKGRLVAALLSISGTRMTRRGLLRAMRAIEARYDVTNAGGRS